MFKKNIIPLFSFYLLIYFVLYFFQNSLIYFPIETNVINNNFNIINNIKNEPIGIITKEKKDKLLVLFHGNFGNAYTHDYYIDFFGDSYQLIIAEYPGYGLNQNQTTKENILLSADELINTIDNKKYKEIIIVGESLGTGVASKIATKYNFKKLLLITPYSSILDVAQDKIKIFPLSFILNNNFDSIDNLTSYQGSTLLIIAENDNTIKPKFAFKLFENIKKNKENIIIKNAEHNDWLYLLTNENKKTILQWLSK